MLLLLVPAGLTACSPALNWREVRPEGSGAVVTLPCKPSREVRKVPLAGVVVPITVTACRAGSAMYALSFADVGEAGRVAPALQALREAAVGNLRGNVLASQPARVEGMTPDAQAQRLSIKGALPDGTQVQEQLAVFSKGTRVFQATLFGARLEPDAVETFFGGLRVPE
jgi:hypothetical protein